MTPPTLVATAKATNANSYVDVATAATYLSGRPNTTAWDNASTDDQTIACIAATMRLETEVWQGSRTTSTQRLAWPRSGVTDFEGWPLENGNIDTIPVLIQNATAELALALLQTPTLLERNALDAFTSLAVPGVSLDTRGSALAGAVLPPMVRRMLATVREAGSGGSGVLLVRG